MVRRLFGLKKKLYSLSQSVAVVITSGEPPTPQYFKNGAKSEWRGHFSGNKDMQCNFESARRNGHILITAELGEFDSVRKAKQVHGSCKVETRLQKKLMDHNSHRGNERRGGKKWYDQLDTKGHSWTVEQWILLWRYYEGKYEIQ